MGILKRLSINVQDELHRQLKVHAAKQGLTMSQIITAVLTDYVRKNNPHNHKDTPI